MPNSAESVLVNNQQLQGLSIFSCDAHAVLQGFKSKQAQWLSVANTNVFINVWNQIHQDGRYAVHDFTVKVDPDAVFFPDRLKQHLWKLRPPPNTAMYLTNCNFKFRFMGSLEVLSKKAVDAYIANQALCSKHIGHDGGEDFYMKTCLDAIGVGHMDDPTLLRDRYDSDSFPGQLIVNTTSECNDGWAVAYHPHKFWEWWRQCHDVAQAAGSVSR